jgi:predicted secreted protein
MDLRLIFEVDNMKKLVSIFLGTATAVLLAMVAISAGSICDNAPCEDAVNVTAGENFTIELKSIAGSTGFVWWTQFDTEYLNLVSSSEQSGDSKPGWVGVPGKKIFVFSAKKPGSTDVIMLLIQPWENSTVAERNIFPVNIS